MIIWMPLVLLYGIIVGALIVKTDKPKKKKRKQQHELYICNVAEDWREVSR